MSDKEQYNQEDEESEDTMHKYASAGDSFGPRRSFIKGDISATQFSIGEKGDIEINNVDKHGNAVFRDKFGNIKCIANEDLQAGLVPDLDYQEKYKIQQHVTRDGEVRGSVSVFQDAFYQELENQRKALNGSTVVEKRKLPTGKKLQESQSLPALQKTQEIRSAFDEFGKDRNQLDKIAQTVREAREREKMQKQGNKRPGIKISCGACDKQLDSAEYSFCPYCGAEL
jgi:hypothetical protein